MEKLDLRAYSLPELSSVLGNHASPVGTALGQLFAPFRTSDKGPAVPTTAEGRGRAPAPNPPNHHADAI